MKRFLAIILAAFIAAGVCSCKKEEKTEEKPKTHETVNEVGSDAEEDALSEAETETIYAKTPEEAADKCIEAFKSGNLYEARNYVAPSGNAFSELSSFRGKMLKSFGVENNEKLTKEAEKLVENVLKQFKYTRESVKINEDVATVSYSVSMPDTQSIDYSRYSDAYMASKEMTQEELMLSLEGMSGEEAENWAMEYSLGVMNYIFESGGSFDRVSETTTVTVRKYKDGWLVSDIKNL